MPFDFGSQWAGKTYILAKIMADALEARFQAASSANEEISEANAKDLEGGGIVVIRFLGTTPFCSNVSALMASIIEQMKRAYSIAEEIEIPSDFGKLKSLFRSAVMRSEFLKLNL